MASVDPKMLPLLPPLLPPLPPASTCGQGKPHGTEVVGPGEWRKMESGLKPFQRHRSETQVCHIACSLCSTPRVNSHWSPHLWSIVTHLVLMATTQPHLEISIPYITLHLGSVIIHLASNLVSVVTHLASHLRIIVTLLDP